MPKVVTPARIVALLTPVFSAVSGIGLAWLGRHFPGLPRPTASELLALEVTGATTAAGAAVKWLHGQSAWERDQARWKHEESLYEPVVRRGALLVQAADPGLEHAAVLAGESLLTHAVGEPAAQEIETVAEQVATVARTTYGCKRVTGDTARDQLVADAHTATLACLPDAGATDKHTMSEYDRRLLKAAAANGIVNGPDALAAAIYSRTDFSIVCTSLLMESYGGRNMWGGDPGGDALPTDLFEQDVTPAGWATYWANVKRGLRTNGCGPGQLTSEGLQEAANSIGGCWLPGPNMKVAAIFMRQLLAATGGDITLAYQHYNGSGPAAIAYGQRAAAIEARLHHLYVGVR